MLFGSSRSFIINRVIALTTALLGVVVTMMLGFTLPDVVVISRWESETMFWDSLRIAADGSSWLVALALVLGLLSACLRGLSGRSEHLGLHHAGSLLVIACALVSVFADNLITLAVAWVSLDLTSYCLLVLVRREKCVGTEFNVRILAIALVIAAALVDLESGRMPVLSGGNMSARSVMLLMLAVILRLGLYPVHVDARRVVGSPQAVVEIESVTWLAAWAVSVDILGVIASQHLFLPLRIWLTVAALASGLVGGWRWYSASLPQEYFKHMFLAQAGVIMLTFLWGGEWAVAGVIARGMSVLFVGSVLMFCRGNIYFTRSWPLISLLTVLALGSVPMTVGFVGAMALYSGLLQSGMWVLILPIVWLIEAMLIAGAVRLTRLVQWGSPLTQAPFANIGYQIGLIIPVAATVFVGLFPRQLGIMAGVVDVPDWPEMITPVGFSMLGSVLLAGALGGGLWYFSGQLQIRTFGASIRRLALLSMFELRWVHNGTLTICRAIARLMRVAALVLEGHGGVLWALVLVTIAWLALES